VTTVWYCGAGRLRKDSLSGTVPITMSTGSFMSVYWASTYN